MVLDTLCRGLAQLCFLLRVSSLLFSCFPFLLFLDGADLCSSIDGVLLHKSTPIPGARDTLKYLQKNGIPFIFLTNGGGKSEAERAAQLSELLGIDMGPETLVQSHTPFKALARLSPQELTPTNINTACLQDSEMATTGLRDKTILVLGSDASKARRIATEYGFESVVTPGDILKACPEIFPFDPLTEFYNKQEILPLPKPIYSPKDGPQTLEDCLRIHAILIFNDPRDWAVDVQLIKDLAFSYKGYLGTIASDYPSSGQLKSPVQIIFSNGDYEWSSGYHLPRLGQGAFKSALRGSFWRELVSQNSKDFWRASVFQFGKPRVISYAYAESVLKSQLQKLSGTAPPLERVYMVGDNPASDMEGARRWNTHNHISQFTGMVKADESGEVAGTVGTTWTGCLVKTGVYKDDRQIRRKEGKPDVVLDDVKSVVQWALQREGRSHGELL